MPPTDIDATRVENDSIALRWTPVKGALGVDIEVRLVDGRYRSIGVAPGDARGATVSTVTLPAVAVRLRSWNAAGTSEPSADSLMASPRTRAVR